MMKRCIIMAFTFFDCKNAIKMKLMRDTCHLLTILPLLTIPRLIEIQCRVSKSNPQEGPANSKNVQIKHFCFLISFLSFLSRVIQSRGGP